MLQIRRFFAWLILEKQEYTAWLMKHGFAKASGMAEVIREVAEYHYHVGFEPEILLTFHDEKLIHVAPIEGSSKMLTLDGSMPLDNKLQGPSVPRPEFEKKSWRLDNEVR